MQSSIYWNLQHWKIWIFRKFLWGSLSHALLSNSRMEWIQNMYRRHLFTFLSINLSIIETTPCQISNLREKWWRRIGTQLLNDDENKRILYHHMYITCCQFFFCFHFMSFFSFSNIIWLELSKIYLIAIKIFLNSAIFKIYPCEPFIFKNFNPMNTVWMDFNRRRISNNKDGNG